MTLVVIALAGCDSLDHERHANAFELNYVDIAAARRDPSFCTKIASDAFSSAPLSSPGTKLSLTRSECFWDVAKERRDPTLCDEVRPISTWLLDGSDFTPENCRKDASWQGHRASYGYQVDDLLLDLLGYMTPDATIPPNGAPDTWLYIHDLPSVLRSAEFGRRAAQLPDFTAGDSVARIQLQRLAPKCKDSWDVLRLCQQIDCALARWHRPPKCEEAR